MRNFITMLYLFIQIQQYLQIKITVIPLFVKSVPFLFSSSLSCETVSMRTLKIPVFCCIMPSCVLLSTPPQRKELGVVLYNCSCLALDLHRVFSFYWQLHDRSFIPSIWSRRVTALYGKHEALELQLNATPATAYVSVRNISFSIVKVRAW